MNEKLVRLLNYIDGVIERTQHDIDFRRRVTSSERFKYVADGKESVLDDVKYIREQLEKLIIMKEEMK